MVASVVAAMDPEVAYAKAVDEAFNAEHDMVEDDARFKEIPGLLDHSELRDRAVRRRHHVAARAGEQAIAGLRYA